MHFGWFQPLLCGSPSSEAACWITMSSASAKHGYAEAKGGKDHAPVQKQFLKAGGKFCVSFSSVFRKRSTKMHLHSSHAGADHPAGHCEGHASYLVCPGCAVRVRPPCGAPACGGEAHGADALGNQSRSRSEEVT